MRGWKIDSRERSPVDVAFFLGGATNAKLKSVSPEGDEGVTMIVGKRAFSSAMGNFKSKVKKVVRTRGT